MGVNNRKKILHDNVFIMAFLISGKDIMKHELNAVLWVRDNKMEGKVVHRHYCLCCLAWVEVRMPGKKDY